MNLSLNIARRYLFAKKSTNAINIITGISVLGIAIGTAALVLVLSIFNGFEDLISKLFSNFNPDIKVAPAYGKTFSPDSTKIVALKKINGVAEISQVLEEIAFLEYEGSQDFATIKGVDDAFHRVTDINNAIKNGQYGFNRNNAEFAVLGGGVADKLGLLVSEESYLAMNIYMPKTKETSALEAQFTVKPIFPGGEFRIQQEYDGQYVLTSLDFAKSLLLTENISALEIKMSPNANKNSVIKEIEAIMGQEFTVKDRYRQNEAFLKIMNIEKWLGFAIASLVMFLVAFNMIGALWMIVLEKQKDISILKSMGAEDKMIRNIFLSEGFFISALGIIIGFVLAISFYLIQKNYGIIRLSDAFVVDAFPISLRWMDLVVVTFTVLLIGFIASIAPAKKAMNIATIVRD